MAVPRAPPGLRGGRPDGAGGAGGDVAGNLVLGLLLATALVLEARHGRWSGRSIDPHWRAAGLAPVVVAFVIGNGAKRGGTPFCRPDSLLQGHAAWNLGVVAAYCLYRLHASDRAVSGASRA